MDNFLDKKIVVTQVKSGLKLTDRQKGNIIGLGLRGIGSKATLVASKDVLGMVRKISHILKVELA